MLGRQHVSVHNQLFRRALLRGSDVSANLTRVRGFDVRRTEVDQFDVSYCLCSVIVVDENIFRFDIGVHQFQAGHLVQRRQYFAHHVFQQFGTTTHVYVHLLVVYVVHPGPAIE